jgi:hypothetical protein
MEEGVVAVPSVAFDGEGVGGVRGAFVVSLNLQMLIQACTLEYHNR